MHWEIVTGEYPPQPGGISDYTRLVAQGLVSAGDRVDVFAPPCHETTSPDPGVAVHRLPDHFGPQSLRLLTRALARDDRPHRLLVQYVPHAFGWKALNFPFCVWLWKRRRSSVWVVFHEVAFPIERGQPLRLRALGIGTHIMAALVGRAAERVFVSTMSWGPALESLVRPGTLVEWLPVSSNVAVVEDPAGSAHVRAIYAGKDHLVGHFGTYGRALRIHLDETLAGLLASQGCRVLLIGRGSVEARLDFLSRHGESGDRIHATGELTSDEISRHVSGCDLMVQPYPDGITTRRTSAILALAHGRPLVTTAGPLTESFWAESGAVVLVPVGNGQRLAAVTHEILRDRERQRQLAQAGTRLFEDRFDIRHVIRALRTEPAGPETLARDLRL